MDFLKGIARAGGMDFVRLGNGRPDTDYRAKGEKVVELLAAGYELVVCHVNAPDEASHMGDRRMKVESLQAFDEHTLGPALRWFRAHPERRIAHHLPQLGCQRCLHLVRDRIDALHEAEAGLQRIRE